MKAVRRSVAAQTFMHLCVCVLLLYALRVLAVVQRVLRASVSVEKQGYRAAIGPGLCVLLGVEIDDGAEQASWMAGKLARLRIFRDDDDKMNRSVQDIAGEILVVSQFTLCLLYTSPSPRDS